MIFDFRLKVFQTVAHRLNFTRAAEELFITQPAVTKHIHELEAHFKKQLFERQGSKITLTSAGKILLQYTESIFDLYRKIEIDMAAENQEVKGTIRIGASTTVASYVLPKYLSKFKEKFEDIEIQVKSGNTENIELALIENKIDTGVVEGRSSRKELKYLSFLKDEIVLCTRTNNPTLKSNVITRKKFLELPMLMREQGSGTLDIIYASLKKAGIKPAQINTEMIFESTESIKSYLINSNCFAFLSIHSILTELQNNTLSMVEIKSLMIERYFYIVQQQGDQKPLSQLLIKFLKPHNLRL